MMKEGNETKLRTKEMKWNDEERNNLERKWSEITYEGKDVKW